MNQTQLKYAKQRAEEIRQAKHAKIRMDNYTAPKILTGPEKVAALKNGDYTIDENLLKNTYYWYQAVKFNGEVLASTDADKIKEQTAKVDANFRKVMDELMLGDNEEAIKLLAAFEAS